MKNSLIITIFLFATIIIKAQNNVGNEFIGDVRIDTLIHLHKLQNRNFPYISGYRIQIYKETGNNALDSAWSEKIRFEKKYYGIHAYISFREPYYRVRVGDFRTRLDALRFLDKIKRYYPYAWDIKDKIRFDNKEEIKPPNTPKL